MTEQSEAGASRIRAMIWRDEGAPESGGPELIARWEREDRESCLWVDIEGPPGSRENQILEETFEVEPAVIATAQSPRYPPKVDLFPELVFMLLRGLDADSASIEFGTIQIGMFVGRRFLVTRHSLASPSTEHAWEQVARDPELRGAGPAAVAMTLARRLAQRYLPIVLNLETRLEEMEDEMFESPGDELLGELLVYKRQLKKLRRIASYHVNLFTRLREEESMLFGRDRDHELQDVVEQMERIASLSALYNELANDLMNAYLSLSSHRLNHIMKVLTIVTVIFVPLTFLAGIYGMNFEFMPELGMRYAYFTVLGVMLTLGVALLWLFRRRGWM